MSVTSMTVQAAQIYDELLDVNGKRYKNLTEDSILCYYTYNYGRWFVLRFPDLKSTLGHKKIISVVPHIHIHANNSWSLSSYALASPLPNEGNVYSYTAMPRVKSTSCRAYKNKHSSSPLPGEDVTMDAILPSSSNADEISIFAYWVLVNRAIEIGTADGASNAIFLHSTMLDGSTPPYIVINYDTDLVAREISTIYGTTDGYFNPREARTIGWKIERASTETYQCLNTIFLPDKVKIYWRETGTSPWNEISVADGSSEVTIPANTFPASTSIQWYISIIDEDGVTVQSSVFTQSTTDGTATATPTAPVGSVENGGEVIRFEWSVSNTTGQPPSRVVIEWATTSDAVSWTELCDLSGAYFSYDAPANTFPGGNVYWRVTAYNQDSVVGPTSDPAAFQCIAPPAVPTGIFGDGVPFTTISWQSQVQSAFEITIDGILIARKFGPGVYTYQLEEPLEDGDHEVSIRVQNAYGIWSGPGTTTIHVTNAGADTITLTGAFDVDAALEWICTSSEEDIMYRVYRDNVLIGKTKLLSFKDRFALGEHRYRIIAELTGGYCIRSNEISGIMKSCTTRIAEAAGGEWLDLQLSENSNSVQNFSWSRGTTLRHYAGAVYPVAELSPYEDRVASYDCAFRNVADAAAFEALRGKIVIMKSRGGEVCVGALTQLMKVTGDFYIAYTFSLQQLHWEDIVYDTDS